MQAIKKGLVWFKNDLRVHDNATLANAVQDCEQVLPIFIIDPRWSASTIYGFKKTGHFRMQFIYESVKALQQSMQNNGSDLFIFEGLPEEILPELILKYQISDIYTKQEFGCDEKDINKKVKQISSVLRINHHQFNTQTLFDFENIKLNHNEFPNQFSDFVTLLQAQKPFRNIVQSPSSIATIACNNSTDISIFEKYFNSQSSNKDTRTLFPFSGGEQNALSRLHNYIWDKQILSYHSNDIIDESTKFSPWFAQGCLSVAVVYNEIKNYQAKHESNAKIENLIMDLYWRDFFYFTFEKYGVKFFRQGGVYNKQLVCIKDFEALQLWIEAQTKDNYTNANMKEIAKTGWMSADGRRHVANYLSKQLLIDWRIGGAYFESQLLDYDVCMNYGNWASMAGVSSLLETEVKFNSKPKSELENNQAYIHLWMQSK